MPDTFGGEEWLEDMGLHFRRDAWPVIADLDQYPIQFARGADAQFTLAVHSVDSIVDEVGPDLVQLAAVRADLRQGTIEIKLYRDAMF